MKKWTTSRAARVIAVVLFLALGAGGFWATLFTGSQWDTLWLGSTYYDSSDCWDDLSNRALQARELARELGGDYPLLVCLGGDGTLSDVMAGLMDLEINRLALILSGLAVVIILAVAGVSFSVLSDNKKP